MLDYRNIFGLIDTTFILTASNNVSNLYLW